MTNGNHGNRNRLLSLAMIGVFDIAGPLVAYSMLRSAGQSQVSALILSGAFPALGILVSVIRHRRVDTIGVLVLAGIAVGTVLGLLSGSPRLVLAEGSVPTAVFGLLCLGSLWARRPLIYRFAIEFIGAGTPRGREFESLWQYPAFRHSFRLYTLVWGVVYLAEVALVGDEVPLPPGRRQYPAVGRRSLGRHVSLGARQVTPRPDPAQVRGGDNGCIGDQPAARREQHPEPG